MPKEIKKWRLSIKGDYNDADYTTSTYDFTDKEWEEYEPLIERFGKAIKQAGGDYWAMDWEPHRGRTKASELYTKEYGFTEEEFEIFNQFTPRGEGGVHSIESIELAPIGKIIKYY